jgi:hypothetical protein
MKAAELKDMLTSHLVRSTGGTRQQWRRAIGEFVLYSMDTHPHCNWDVRPAGKAAEVEAVNQAVDVLRMIHPHVSAD